jgi:hypothetical protein
VVHLDNYHMAPIQRPCTTIYRGVIFSPIVKTSNVETSINFRPMGLILKLEMIERINVRSNVHP